METNQDINQNVEKSQQDEKDDVRLSAKLAKLVKTENF